MLYLTMFVLLFTFKIAIVLVQTPFVNTTPFMKNKIFLRFLSTFVRGHAKLATVDIKENFYERNYFNIFIKYVISLASM